MPHHIFVDDVAILFGVCKHVWPWPYDAHITFEDVEKLWELVDVGHADEVAKRKFPGVFFGGLQGVGVVVDMHGPKFVADESFAVETCTCLSEEDRSWALVLDDECDDGYEGEHHNTYDEAHDDVERSLQKPVER